VDKRVEELWESRGNGEQMRWGADKGRLGNFWGLMKKSGFPQRNCEL
jgi:hypothetical protein